MNGKLQQLSAYIAFCINQNFWQSKYHLWLYIFI